MRILVVEDEKKVAKRWKRGSKRSATKWRSRIPEKTDSI